MELRTISGKLIHAGDFATMKELVEEAVLLGKPLRYADLQNANLWNANLRYVNLRNADLRYADLRYANLRDADLRYANLRDANLRNADLRDANLRDANLRYANLRNISYNYLTTGINLTCPEEGSFIAWKKCYLEGVPVVVKLQITETAKRSSATTRKCRCSEALVLEIDGSDIAYSDHDPSFMYKVGEIAKVDDFDDDRWNECSTGIHFFMTEKEASEW